MQAELAALLLHEVRDPRVAGAIVSDVRVTPDLKIARVYVRHLAVEPDRTGIMAGLQRAGAFLRAKLGERLDLRWVPELRFEYDQLVDDAARIERLLAENASDESDGS